MVVSIENVASVLATIDDPEMPISIVDLGLVEQVTVSGDTASVIILPTFVGCPALPMIENEIREKVIALPGIETVNVRFVHDPPWSVDRITTAGREQLRGHGVTVPDQSTTPDETVALHASAIPCPFCGARKTRLDSPFGPTRCRTIWYCDGCRNTFEHMKRV